MIWIKYINLLYDIQKTIDKMGQLFPTWSNEPDHRCIYCFSYDQVFALQQFMIHHYHSINTKSMN